MQITIEQATTADIKELGLLYDTVCTHLENNINYPGWKKGIYPIEEDAAQAVREGSLYTAKTDGKIIGSVILRHEPEVAYASADWHTDLDYSDILVIYTFAIHPAYQNQGIGSKMMEFIKDHSQKTNIKAIRLDVHQKNTPAIQLYKKHGFQYIDTVDLGYSDFGLSEFELYQLLL